MKSVGIPFVAQLLNAKMLCHRKKYSIFRHWKIFKNEFMNFKKNKLKRKSSLKNTLKKQSFFKWKPKTQIAFTQTSNKDWSLI